MDFDTRTWSSDDRDELSRLQKALVAEWNVLAFADTPPASYPDPPDVI